VVSVLGALIAACGSGGASSQRQFVNAANLICYRAETALGPSPSSIKNLPSFGREVARDLTIYVRQLHELQAVKVPSQDRTDYSALLRALSKENELLRKAIPPLLANKLKEAREFSSSLSPATLAVYNDESKLGLVVCEKAA
jgi:hypothetical protein